MWFSCINHKAIKLYNIFSYDAADPNAGIGRYANDDWIKPNCKIKLRVCNRKPMLFIYALKDIAEGRELKYNYGDPSSPWRSVYIKQTSAVDKLT